MNERGKVYGDEMRKVKGDGVGKLGVRCMPCVESRWEKRAVGVR